MLILYVLPMICGFALDLIFGDPHQFPHIVVGMGKLIASLEKYLRSICPKTEEGERRAGVLLVILVLLICMVVSVGVLFLADLLSFWLGFIVKTFLCYQLLATKSLSDESMKVYHSLKNGDLTQARRDASMIVGRDTDALDETGVTKAAVETIAENTSDGVIAPLFYMMLGGPVLGCLYKAVNTMDSMVGYKNDAYLQFGRAAAKLDDVLNFIPARLAARLMIIATFLLGLDAKHAKIIYRRDKRNHASPNAGHTEAVCAGALNVRLAGDAYYFGKRYEKPYIGDDVRPIEPMDIPRANKLMFVTAVLMVLLAVLVRAIMGGV